MDGDDLGDEPDSQDRFRLPASFTGSPQYFADRTANALALSRQRGKPDFLITATCNPAWPELRALLEPGQAATEVPHITVRVFKVSIILPFVSPHLPPLFALLTSFAFQPRLSKLIKAIKSLYGVDYHVYVIEFQKRGLPHAHIVIKVCVCSPPLLQFLQPF